jgi:hypothetical protein
MAKPKIKGKEGSVAHGVVRDGRTDYNAIIEALASFLWRVA